MRLGRLLLRDDGPGFGVLKAPTGVVLREGPVAACTNTWLRYEDLSDTLALEHAAAKERRRERRERRSDDEPRGWTLIEAD